METERIKIEGDVAPWGKSLNQAESRYRQFATRVEKISSGVSKINAIATGFGLIGVFSQLSSVASAISSAVDRSAQEFDRFRTARGGGGGMRFTLPSDLPLGSADISRRIDELRGQGPGFFQRNYNPFDNWRQPIAGFGESGEEQWRNLQRNTAALERLEKSINDMAKLSEAEELDTLRQQVVGAEARARGPLGETLKRARELDQELYELIVRSIRERESTLQQLKIAQDLERQYREQQERKIAEMQSRIAGASYR